MASCLIFGAAVLSGLFGNNMIVDGQGIIRCPGECEFNPCGCCEDNLDCYCESCDSRGCSKCMDGTWKWEDQYKCEPCEEIFGDACKLCDDFDGCVQCDEDHDIAQDSKCGLNYCQPKDGTPVSVAECGEPGEVGSGWTSYDPSCVSDDSDQTTTIYPSNIPDVTAGRAGGPTIYPSIIPDVTAGRAGGPTIYPSIIPDVTAGRGGKLTDEPSYEPTDEPTSQPTDEPTSEPTDNPTDLPTDYPTNKPTKKPVRHR